MLGWVWGGSCVLRSLTQNAFELLVIAFYYYLGNLLEWFILLGIPDFLFWVIQEQNLKQFQKLMKFVSTLFF